MLNVFRGSNPDDGYLVGLDLYLRSAFFRCHNFLFRRRRLFAKMACS
jgi:hypothetical protein